MTQEQIQFILDNYLVMTYKQLASSIGVTEAQVKYVLKRLGLKKRVFNKGE